MSKTLMSIKVDTDAKVKAQKIARDFGLPLSTLMNAYLWQLIRTKEIHFFLEGELKPSVKKRLDRLTKEAKAGKNISGPFSTGKEMDTYLDSLNK